MNTGPKIVNTSDSQENLLVCAKCMQPLKPGAQFCAHCGATVTAARKGKKRGMGWALWGAIVVAVIVANRHKDAPVESPKGIHASEVASLDAMLNDRIGALTAQIKQLGDAEGSVQATRDELTNSIPDLDNFRNRLKTAATRADDEDRWPVKVAGREFTKSQAADALKRVDQYVAKAKQSIGDCDRTIAQYDSAIAPMQQMRDQLRSQQARLDAGFAESDFAELRAQAKELANNAQASHVQIGAPANPVKALDLDSLLK